MKALMKSTILAAMLTLLAIMAACGDASDQPAATRSGNTQPQATIATKPPTSEPTSSKPTSAPATPDTEPEPTSAPVAQQSAATQTPSVNRPHPTLDPAAPTLGPGPTPKSTPTPTPNPEKGGICARHENVRAAILRSLNMTSCSKVTEAHLAQITELHGISVGELPASEVAGLSNIESLSFEISSGVFSLKELTALKNLDITINVPGEELPLRQLELAIEASYKTTREDDWETPYDKIKMTINPGGNHRNDANASQAVTYCPTRNTLHCHIVNRTRSAFGSFPGLSHGIARFTRAGTTLKTFDVAYTYEFDSGATEPGRIYFEERSIEQLPNKLTIINHSENTQLRLQGGLMAGPSGSSGYPVELEIRGNIGLDIKAFADILGLKTLHVDPDEDGNPHVLRFHRDYPAPEGTGFVVAD